MKYLGLVIVICCGGLLLSATQDFPSWGDPSSPASTHVSPRYISQSVDETHVPNLVTAVLADYRSFDTMFEAVVIFCAGLACILLLRVYTQRARGLYYRHILTGVILHIKDPNRAPTESDEFELMDTLWVPHDLIIKTVCSLLIPFIQLFALYVVAHGHYSPGGGFQGGVIFGASLILLAISTNLNAAVDKFTEKVLFTLSALGVIIYAGIGLVCMALGGNFLDYSRLSLILPVGPVHARYLAMLGVEIGVGVTVMAVMALLYFTIASAGRFDEGL